MRNYRLFLTVAFIIILAFVFTGCGGGSGSGGGGDTPSIGKGSYKATFTWPGVGKTAREIPDVPTTLNVHIENKNYSGDFTQTVGQWPVTVTYDEILTGPTVATIKALDSQMNVLYQSKTSFTVNKNQTTEGGTITLGVAITNSKEGLCFSPSQVYLPNGADLPFQNWTDSSVKISGLDQDFSLNAASQVNNLWVFDSHSVNVSEDMTAHIAGASCTCTISIPVYSWQNSFGGTGSDSGFSIIDISEEYLAVGYTDSNDGDVTGYKGGGDLWKAVFSSKGKLVSQKCYGGSGFDQGYQVIKNRNGQSEKFAIAAVSDSSDGDLTGNNGDKDAWIIELDSTGNMIWQKNFGGSKHDNAKSVYPVTETSYVFCGESWSNDGDVTGHHGSTAFSDIWVGRINNGSLAWQKSLGGSSFETAGNIYCNYDEEFILTGSTFSTDGDVTGHHGDQINSDAWVVKLDSSGEIIWQKALGGSANDYGVCVSPSLQGGYIMAGHTFSTDGDVTSNHGESDLWLVKLDSNGEIEWQKTYGGSDLEEANWIFWTIDGGYIVTADSKSSDGDLTGNNGDWDYWVVKLDSNGSIQWQKNLGGSSTDFSHSIDWASDLGYTVLGASYSNDGDVSGHHGTTDKDDWWIVKLDSSGNLVK